MATHPLTKNDPTPLLAVCSFQFKGVPIKYNSTWINGDSGFEWVVEMGLAKRENRVRGGWPAPVFQLRKTVITTQAILSLDCHYYLLGKLCSVYCPIWIQFSQSGFLSFEKSPLLEKGGLWAGWAKDDCTSWLCLDNDALSGWRAQAGAGSGLPSLLSPGPGLGELGERTPLCNWSEFF